MGNRCETLNWGKKVDKLGKNYIRSDNFALKRKNEIVGQMTRFIKVIIHGRLATHEPMKIFPLTFFLSPRRLCHNVILRR
jgi:hypothetical protein